MEPARSYSEDDLLELADELPETRREQRLATILALEISEAQVVWAAVPVPSPPASSRMARGSTSPATYPFAPRSPSRALLRLCLFAMLLAACGVFLVQRGYVVL